jgi:hypothetical protein
VKDLLSLHAKCTKCGHRLAEIGERMQRTLDDWTEFAAAIQLCLEVERQYPSLHYEDDAITRVHCLGDLVDETEAMLTDLPERERRASALDAVRAAFQTVFPKIACPPLGNGIAGTLRASADDTAPLR